MKMSDLPDHETLPLSSIRGGTSVRNYFCQNFPSTPGQFTPVAKFSQTGERILRDSIMTTKRQETRHFSVHIDLFMLVLFVALSVEVTQHCVTSSRAAVKDSIDFMLSLGIVITEQTNKKLQLRYPLGHQGSDWGGSRRLKDKEKGTVVQFDFAF